MGRGYWLSGLHNVSSVKTLKLLSGLQQTMCPLDDTLHLRGEQCHMTVAFFVLYDGGQIFWECLG